MRIVNIDTASGWRVGVMDDEHIIDLNRAAQLIIANHRAPNPSERGEAEIKMPSAFSSWLNMGSDASHQAAKWATVGAHAVIQKHGLPWAIQHQLVYLNSKVQLAPPIGYQANVLAIGLNYKSHALEAKMDVPKFPMVFTKPQPSVIGPMDPITIPKASRRIDYEGEIVIVIGNRCKEVDEQTALSCIAGYTLANDVSARDWQFRTTEMMLGKAFDGFCPIGPWLLTQDELPDISQVLLETKVNGEVRQSALASDMIFSPAFLVSYLSQVMTLQAGDAILTGTPAGIGATRDPRLWLSKGDCVEVSAGPLGTLVTTFDN